MDFEQLDAMDRRILKMLQLDGKVTIKEMANQLHMTNTPVFERVKRLEREGFIKQYTAILDRQKIGLQMVVFCTVSLKVHHADFLERFEQEVTCLEEVVECYHIAGMFDYLLKVVIKDMDVYRHFVSKKLAALENIGKVQSSFVMTEIRHSTALPIS
ncbi:MAG: Lrp/AsnC family transcriptional regulator [Saprospiraceae bacterium]|nr:Lrp/AsnC family transcriptional regulator [Saprospiraceae bacterium]